MEHRTEYDLKAIGRNLKHLRESRHLTVEQVREYLCLGSVQAVYKYESGTGYPQADTLLALMELYGAGVDDIVRGHEEEQGSSFNMRRNREINRIFKVFLRFRAERWKSPAKSGIIIKKVFPPRIDGNKIVIIFIMLSC